MTSRSLLSGDIGGTNARLALYDSETLKPRFQASYAARDFAHLEEVAERFLREATEAGVSEPIAAGTLGIAGPVEGHVSRATNLPWVIDARRLGQRLHIPRLTLVNDFEAIAHAVPQLEGEDLVSLGGGAADSQAPIAVLGPGTGLGQALLLPAAGGRHRVLPSEGGHVDFAPRSPIERGLLEHLTLRYGRVSNERVLCGQGICDLYAFLLEDPAFRLLSAKETGAKLAAASDRAAEISRLGLAEDDAVCRLTLAIFASVLGAVAGNLALSALTRGGVYVAGGIAPKIRSVLEQGGTREAFEHKGRFRPLLERIPLFVVTHPDPGLLGAAHCAAQLVTDAS